MCYFLGFPLKIQPYGYLTKKYTFIPLKKKKNQHGKILKEEPKKQYLSIIPKSCSGYLGSFNTF